MSLLVLLFARTELPGSRISLAMHFPLRAARRHAAEPPRLLGDGPPTSFTLTAAAGLSWCVAGWAVVVPPSGTI